MAAIQPSHPHLHGQRAGHLDVRAARRGAVWSQETSSEPWRGYLPRQSAVQQLFRRWPSVPSRELERIRLVLLHCDEIAHPSATRRLSEPAQALLDLVTGELERRRESGHHQPLNGSPATEHPGPLKLSRARRQGGLP
jgi:hypothetical protein